MRPKGITLSYNITPRLLILALALHFVWHASASDLPAPVISIRGMQVSLSPDSGGLESLALDGIGQVFLAEPGEAGLLDLAAPVHGFLPLRFSTCHARPLITSDDGEWHIRWRRLAPSRSDTVHPRGNFSAEITLRPGPGGRSLLMRARVENHTDAVAPQILFPDLRGLRAFGGQTSTTMRLGSQTVNLFKTVPQREVFFAVDPFWLKYEPSLKGSTAPARAILAGPHGGLVISELTPANRKAHTVYTYRDELNPDHMRLTWEHRDSLYPGEVWESGEYSFTPYTGTWINGIQDVQEIAMNDSKVLLDQFHGNIVGILSPWNGTLLASLPENAGLLRVEVTSRDGRKRAFASGDALAGIERVGDSIVIKHRNLAVPSTSSLTNGITATTRLRPAPDGHSWIMSCQLENQQSTPVTHVVFPNLQGFQPFLGPDQTRLRLSNGVVDPFRDAGRSTYQIGPSYLPSMLRWLDLGGYQGGISMFHRQWRTETVPEIATQMHSSPDAALELSWEHKTQIERGQTWNSGEFWLTPHPGGWAKGIEPFREYVRQVNPPRELPTHIRDDLGFQTVWMYQYLDPYRLAFKYDDLPRIAGDALKHGIHELSVWGIVDYFTLPIPALDFLGGQQKLVKAVRDCAELGVNVSPYINVRYIFDSQRYGITPTSTTVIYHSDLVPPYEPYYVMAPYPVANRPWAEIPNGNKLWEQDLLSSLTDWFDLGITSFGWDVYGGKPGKYENIQVYLKIREEARKRNMQSVFAAESTGDSVIEFDTLVSDYTWQWPNQWSGGFDAEPVMNVINAPRINLNINDDPVRAKKAFCSGRFMNIMPKRPGWWEGATMISARSDLSAVIQQLSHLRRQFLPYFSEGLPLGDSMLSQETPVFVRGWQRANALLIIVLGDQIPKDASLAVDDLKLWLPAAQEYECRRFDEAGRQVGNENVINGHFHQVISNLQLGELRFYEISAR